MESPRAYLSSIVTRLCIDRRQAIEARKETYIGPWLPEPVVESDEADPGGRLEAAESVSLAFLVVLESLAPVERAAYLLRRVFDYGYDEIAAILGKIGAGLPAARQPRRGAHPRAPAAVRARSRRGRAAHRGVPPGLLDRRPRRAGADCSPPTPCVLSDGGGKATAALAPIRGADRVARFFLGLMKKAPAELELRRVRVNGQPGLMTVLGGQVLNVLTLDIADGRIAACFVVRNPDKLSRVPSR